MRNLIDGGQILLALLTAGIGVQAARFAYKASYQNNEELGNMQQWYAAKWQRISSSTWLYLPELIVRWLLNARDSLVQLDLRSCIAFTLKLAPLLSLLLGWVYANQSHPGHLKYKVPFLMLAGLLSIVALEVLTYSRVWSYSLLIVLTGLVGLVMILSNLDWDHRGAILVFVLSSWTANLVADEKTGNSAVAGGALFCLLYIIALSLIVWIYLLGKVTVGWAALTAVLMLPFSIGLIGTVPVFLRDFFESLGKRFTEQSMLLFALSIAISFAVTLCALALGHQVSPSALIPQTQRMLWSNALCDGIAVVLLLYLLERAIPPKRVFSIPVAIALTLLLGLILACASLWLGVKELTITEVTHVLVGRSVNDQQWEVGPYFWAMHTVFIPLLFYMGAVIVCWIGKAAVNYRRWFFGRAKQQGMNGLNMTARFLGLMTALLTLTIALLAGVKLFL